MLLSFEYLQGGRLHNPSGKPIQLFCPLHSKNIFTYAYMEFSVFKLVPIDSCPITGYCWVSPSYLYTVIKYFWACFNFFYFFFSRLNSSISLSLSLYVRCSTFLYWNCFKTPTSLLYCKPRTWPSTPDVSDQCGGNHCCIKGCSQLAIISPIALRVLKYHIRDSQIK